MTDSAPLFAVSVILDLTSVAGFSLHEPGAVSWGVEQLTGIRGSEGLGVGAGIFGVRGSESSS